MKQKRDYYKYGIALILLLVFFVGTYVYEGTPGRLNNRAWAYINPDAAIHDVSEWIYKFEIKDFREGGGHEVYDLSTSKHVPLDGHKVYMLVFKTEHPGILGDSNVYFDFYTRKILGVDLVL